jgi:hypothetical protein
MARNANTPVVPTGRVRGGDGTGTRSGQGTAGTVCASTGSIKRDAVAARPADANRASPEERARAMGREAMLSSRNGDAS